MGVLPSDTDLLKSAVNEGAISFAHSVKSLADIPSGLVALSVVRLDRRGLTFSDEMEKNSRLLWLQVEGEHF